MTEEIRTETVESVNENKKKSFWNENKVEIAVAILLGLTAILTAWATWIGSLHSGIQAINFTKSNNLASEGNAEYNAALQLYLSDTVVWSTIVDYATDLAIATQENNQAKIDLFSEKLKTYAEQNASEHLLKGIKWMDENGGENPFKMPGLTDEYFSAANEKIQESQALLQEGQRDNSKGDAYNLVSVIYSLVMFLLGIIGIFKRLPNRVAVLTIAIVGLVLITIYMCTIPLPTGFDPLSYIGVK